MTAPDPLTTDVGMTDTQTWSLHRDYPLTVQQGAESILIRACHLEPGDVVSFLLMPPAPANHPRNWKAANAGQWQHSLWEVVSAVKMYAGHSEMVTVQTRRC